MLWVLVYAGGEWPFPLGILQGPVLVSRHASRSCEKLSESWRSWRYLLVDPICTACTRTENYCHLAKLVYTYVLQHIPKRLTSLSKAFKYCAAQNRGMCFRDHTVPLAVINHSSRIRGQDHILLFGFGFQGSRVSTR